MPLAARFIHAFFCKATLPGWALLLSCAVLQVVLPLTQTTLGRYLIASLACYAVMLAFSVALRVDSSTPSPLRHGTRQWHPGRRRSATLWRLAYKTGGVAATLLGAAFGAVALAVWQADIYEQLARALPWAFLVALGVSGWLVMYVLDAFDRAPWDGYYRIGRWLQDRRRPLPPSARTQLQFSVVRGFFVSYGVFVLSVHLQMQAENTGDKNFFDALLQITDLAKITLGIGSFIVVSRMLGNHPRSVDTNPVAWLATLACYPPLGIWQSIFTASGMGTGEPQLTGMLLWLHQAVLVFLMLIYASDTLAWGDRFSQLSYRGLVSSGPFAFMRHPAYTSKCLIMALTILPATTLDNWQASYGFVALICSLYVLRGYTESMHLRRYPEYVALYSKGRS